ncbi:hypothetical protein Tco_1017372 [Tanacetum coccineum]|uniref:Uncharacterized protein n=1 Tax=Tanacetum coccineum TaxID=301880 RepID=A0ABQ5FTA1_9ASTR
MECKIVGQILINHALSYALTTTADVPAVYIQQFWKTVKQVPNANNTIRFTIDRETISYTDFIHYIQQKKDVTQYPRVTKFIIVDLIKKFPSIAQRLYENYHSIKDDIPLVSMYTTGNMTLVESTQETNRIPRATRIPTPAAIEKKKRKQVAGESSTPRKSLKVTIKQKKPSTAPIPPLSNYREMDEIAEATLRSLTMHKTAIAAEAQENVAKVQENILEEDIAKMVDGEDEDSYASVKTNLITY